MLAVRMPSPSFISLYLLIEAEKEGLWNIFSSVACHLEETCTSSWSALDATYYYGARYYEPKAARWLSGDPAIKKFLPSKDKNKMEDLSAGGGVYNHFNLNLYDYVQNNPVRLIDPSGEETWVFFNHKKLESFQHSQSQGRKSKDNQKLKE